MPTKGKKAINLFSLLARGLLLAVLASEHADDLGDLEGDLCILLEAKNPGANASFAGNEPLNHNPPNSKP